MRCRLEAELLWRERPGPLPLFGVDRMRRHLAIKVLTHSLPFRPMLRRLNLLIINRGLLDGSAGVVYPRMMAAYESTMTTHLARLRSGIRP